MRSSVRDRFNEAVEKATALDTVRVLMGYVEDGSDISITLCQDDATKEYSVTAKLHGAVLWSESGSTLLKAIENAGEAHLPPTELGEEF